MDEKGREMALEKVNGLTPDGGTNLWDGLKTGLDTVKNSGNILFSPYLYHYFQ